MASRELPLIIQPRDLDLLRGLFESRLMTLRHVAGLHFEGRVEAAKKRLQKLKSAGVLAEQARHVNEPAVLYLTRKGYRILETHGQLVDYEDVPGATFAKRGQISAMTRRHELAVMDVKTAFTGALRTSKEFELSQFSTWPALHRFTALSGGYKVREIHPDGFIEIRRKDGSGDFSFFLEVDRSSETQGILAAKAACYVEYYRSGGFAERSGGTASQFEQFPFRLLLVCKNAERRNNAADAMLHLRTPIYRQVWLTTESEVMADPLGPIWMCPIDLSEATKGTPFDPLQPVPISRYKTAKGREAHAALKLNLRRLL